MKIVKELCFVLCFILVFVASDIAAQTTEDYSVSTSVFYGIGGATNGEAYSQPVGSGAQPTPVGISGSPNYRNYAGYLYTLDTLTTQAGDITLTLDDDPSIACGEEWMESRVTMRVTTTLDEDACVGYCSFGFIEGYLGLWPGRLEVDLDGLQLAGVEIDVDNWCAPGNTRAFLYQGGELLDQYNVSQAGPSTIELNANGGVPTRLAVSSCEAAVMEIRLISSGPSVHPSDRDGDAVTDTLDNCPDVFNPGQEDSDGNGTGDVCEGTRGDVDGNDAINVLDVLAVVNNILGTVPLEGNALDWADCDGNGQVNVLDALGIINIILGLIPECPGGEARVEITDEALAFIQSLKPYLGQEKYSRFEAMLKEEMGIQLPLEYCLFQNYPNPFNPSTDIRYQIGDDRSSLRTTLKVFNLLGQEVRTLIDEKQEPGYHTVVWNGKDANGNDVGSGIYFYTLNAGNFSVTRRMVLIR